MILEEHKVYMCLLYVCEREFVSVFAMHSDHNITDCDVV